MTPSNIPTTALEGEEGSQSHKEHLGSSSSLDRHGAEAERAAFEAFAKVNLLPLTQWVDEHGPYYADRETYAAHKAWQAASASKAELLRAAKAVAFSNGFDAALPDKLEALRAAIARATGA